MPESISRLYGPGLISANSNTTLFTVPTRGIYVVRGIEIAAPQQSVAATPITMLGITNTTAGKIVYGKGLTTSTSAPVFNFDSTSLPLGEGEVLVARSSVLTTPSRLDYQAANNTTWTIASSTDATSLATAAFTPQALTTNSMVFFGIANTKASSPDTVSSISDAHTNPLTGFSSLLTAASTGARASIWGANVGGTAPSALATYTINFGGTFTGAWAKATNISPSPFTTTNLSNIVLQTATATGTTETAQGVTMTPSSDSAFQVFVVCCTGAGSNYTGATGMTEIGDQSLAAPNQTAAMYVAIPSITNPTATIAAAGSDWAAACIEVGYGSSVTLTLTGVTLT